MSRLNEPLPATGILIRILYGKNFFSDSAESKALVVNLEVGGRHQKTNHAILDETHKEPEWNQGFYYNTSDLRDDDIKFSVSVDGSFMGSNSFGENTRSFSRLRNAAENYKGISFLKVEY